MARKRIEEMSTMEFLTFLRERAENLKDGVSECEGATRRSIRNGELDIAQGELTNARIFLAQAELMKEVVDQIGRWMDAKGMI